jgi:hypothetical protein
MNCLRWDRSSSLIQGMNDCVLFCVYVAALQRADPPSKESYRLWRKKLRDWKRGLGRSTGCRSVNDWINQISHKSHQCVWDKPDKWQLEISVRNPKGKGQHRRPRFISKDNIKMDLKEIYVIIWTGYGQVTGWYKHAQKHSGSVKFLKNWAPCYHFAYN